MPPETASSWDSYMDTLLAVLHHLKPNHIFEFGSGKSTGIMAMAPSVESIVTVEHDHEYYAKFNRAAFDNLEMLYVPNIDEYAHAFPGFPHGRKYDLIFVDGANRSRCLRESKAYLLFDGLVLLHDAAREEYEEAIQLYKYSVFTDGGHTACLTENSEVYNKLRLILDSLKNTIGVKY